MTGMQIVSTITGYKVMGPVCQWHHIYVDALKHEWLKIILTEVTYFENDICRKEVIVWTLNTNVQCVIHRKSHTYTLVETLPNTKLLFEYKQFQTL